MFPLFSFFNLQAVKFKDVIDRSLGALAKPISVGKENHRFDIKFSGLFSLESFYDSRQIAGSFQDDYMRFPLPVREDPRGLDINDKDQFNMIGVMVYATTDIKGPEIFGAETSAKIEARFSGVNDATIRLFRLNKGYAQFAWPRTVLMLGHMYHPIARDVLLTGDSFYPGVVSRYRGRKYDPFEYVAQARLRHRYREFEIMVALTKHYKNIMARRAVFPDLFLQFTADIKDHVLGFGFDYHVEVPRLETELGFKNTQQIGSLHAYGLALFKLYPFKIKTRVIYSENGQIFDLIGAYAVECLNPVTDERSYVNLRAVNFWFDFTYEGAKRVEPGLFVGVTKNIGAPRNIVKKYDVDHETEISLLEVDGALTNLNNMFIIAPRLRLRWGPFMLGGEIEYVRAAFAKRNFDEDGWENDFDSRARVVNTRPVSNTRFLVATRYFF